MPTETRRTPRQPRPVGAPTAIDDVVAYLDGLPITAGERIISHVARGSYVEAAAAAVNLELHVLYEWMRKGADANRKRATGKALGANEKRFAWFASELVKAEGTAEAEAIGTIYDLGRGGLPHVIETVKVRVIKGKDDAPDVEEEIERTTRTETLAPNAAALTWHADRRWSKRWTRRSQIEISGVDGGPIQVESPLAGLMGQLAAMDRRLRGDVIDTVEIPPEAAAG